MEPREFHPLPEGLDVLEETDDLAYMLAGHFNVAAEQQAMRDHGLDPLNPQHSADWQRMRQEQARQQG